MSAGDQKRSKEPRPPPPDDLPDPPAYRVERPAALRSAGPGHRGQADAGVGTGRMGQDHPVGGVGAGPAVLDAGTVGDRRAGAGARRVGEAGGGDARGLGRRARSPTRSTSCCAGSRRPDPPVTVVLDGVPHAEAGDLLAGIERLLDDGGPRLRLVIGCRRDPDLPLYRWRIAGRADPHRARAAVVDPAGDRRRWSPRTTSPWARPAVAELHGLVEGWPAAVRLAAVSMQGHPEPESIVPTLAQHDRLLREYVAREVLGPVDDDLRSVLAHLSVLDRMTPELLEALTGRGDAHDVLYTLERANLVVAQTGGAMPWYRFHPLLRPAALRRAVPAAAGAAAGAAPARVGLLRTRRGRRRDPPRVGRAELGAGGDARARSLALAAAGIAPARRCGAWCRCRHRRRSRIRGWLWPSPPTGSTPPTRRAPPRSSRSPSTRGPTRRPRAGHGGLPHRARVPERRTTPTWRICSRRAGPTVPTGATTSSGPWPCARRRFRSALRRRHRGGGAAADGQSGIGRAAGHDPVADHGAAPTRRAQHGAGHADTRPNSTPTGPWTWPTVT